MKNQISVHPVSDLSKEQKKSLKRIGKYLTGFLSEQGKKIASDVADAYRKATKDETPQDKADEIIAAAELEEWDVVADELKDDLGGGFEQTAQIILGKLGIDSESAFDLVNERSVAYADNAAAELVAGITETTRYRLRELVTQAIEDAQGVQELQAAIEGDFTFSADRAEMIARTEIGNAHMAGALEGAKASGLDLKKFIIRGSMDFDCPICGLNELEGKIELDDEFPSGDEGPLFHPNCECTLVFDVVKSEG